MFNITLIVGITLGNACMQLLVAETMLSGRRIPPGASRPFRVLVGATGCLMVGLASTFVFSTFAGVWAMWHYREEPELELRALNMPAQHVPSVDVMLPRYKEPWAMFKPTVEAALALDYPGRVEVYVLDDGADADLRERLTKELGLGTRPGLHYTVREDRRYAKGGNMQHGLRISSGDLVCCFDADMVVNPAFLLRLVPHMLHYNAAKGRWGLADDIGLVQTPQSFYNGDDPLVDAMDGNMAHLMNVFYPAYSGIGAAPCIGTGYIAQRAALDDIGGFTCGLAVEDVTTSVCLVAAGWQCRWVAQRLVEGLSPATLSEFYDQRMRWTAGGMQQLFYQGLILRRVPIKPIWGAEWDERVRRGVPGFSRTARFAWVPLTVYWVIPIAVITYCYMAMATQIVIDYRDDHEVPLYMGVAVVIIVCFYQFGMAFPMGKLRELQLSARALYLYLPVFMYALYLLGTGQMNPLRNPKFKASSEAYSNGAVAFPSLAWINVAIVVVGWALWTADVYVASRHHIQLGMYLCIGAEGIMMLWLTWAMSPILKEIPSAFGCGSPPPEEHHQLPAASPKFTQRTRDMQRV